MTTAPTLAHRLRQLERDAAKRRPPKPMPRGLRLVQIGGLYAKLDAGEDDEDHGVWRISPSRWLRGLPAGARVTIRVLTDPPPEQVSSEPALSSSVVVELPPGFTKTRPEWLRNDEPGADPDQPGQPPPVDDNRAPGVVRAERWAETKAAIRDHKSVKGPDDGFADAVRQKRVRVSVLPVSNPTRKGPRR